MVPTVSVGSSVLTNAAGDHCIAGLYCISNTGLGALGQQKPLYLHGPPQIWPRKISDIILTQ